jgi:hypothetical protein
MRRTPAIAFAAVLAATAVAVLAASAAEPRAALAAAAVKAPKSGAKYTGQTAQGHPIELVIQRKSVYYISFRFACGRKAIAATGLQDIPLRRTSKGYRFAIDAHSSMSFSDDQPDENAAVSVKGRFSRTARTVEGSARVRSERCHDTGSISWRAKR